MRIFASGSVRSLEENFMLRRFAYCFAVAASLLVKLGALIVILIVPTQYAIDFQLLGGIWILQTFPSVVLGLYRAPLRGGPLFVGWLVGMISGTWFFVWAGLRPVLPIGGIGTVYIAIIALALNFGISFAGSLVLKKNA